MPALFSDLDGTLADSLNAMRSAFVAFIGENGGNPADFSFDRFNGPPLPEIVAVLRQELGLRQELTSLVAAYERGIDKIYLGVRPIPGASALLQRAKQAGWLIAVVSSNSKTRMHSWLIRNGLADYCDLLVGAEDVTRGKPWPDPYLRAMTLAGVANPIALEDSLQGAQSALSAGLVTYGYQPVDRARLAWPSHVRLVDDLSQLERLLFDLDSTDPLGQIA